MLCTALVLKFLDTKGILVEPLRSPAEVLGGLGGPLGSLCEIHDSSISKTPW